jgi:hypothetical protein
VSQFISRQKRRQIAYALSLFGIVAASFFAFEDIYLKLEAKDQELTRVYGMFDVRGREEYTREVERLKTANTQLEADLRATREQLSSLQESLKPRRLSPEEQRQLTEALARHDGQQFGKISVVAGPSCQECMLYRDQIVKAIKSVPGWNASGDIEVSIRPDLTGIVIGVKDQKTPPPQVDIIADVLKTANLPFRMGTTPHLSPDKFILIIGNKP